jgi:hypothetical protein
MQYTPEDFVHIVSTREDGTTFGTWIAKRYMADFGGEGRLVEREWTDAEIEAEIIGKLADKVVSWVRV